MRFKLVFLLTRWRVPLARSGKIAHESRVEEARRCDGLRRSPETYFPARSGWRRCWCSSSTNVKIHIVMYYVDRPSQSTRRIAWISAEEHGAMTYSLILYHHEKSFVAHVFKWVGFLTGIIGMALLIVADNPWVKAALGIISLFI